MKLKFLLRCLPDRRYHHYNYADGLPVILKRKSSMHLMDTLYFTLLNKHELDTVKWSRYILKAIK